MKVKTLSALAGLGGALILSGTAQANYTGLSTESGGVVVVGGIARQLWHVYANFNDAGDYLTGANGSPTNGALVVESRNALDTAAGTNFFNPGGVANLAPYSPNGSLEFGTFVTIGVLLGQNAPGGTDQSTLSPGFPNFINGNSITNSNMGWFTAGPVEQGNAGGDLKVVMMQLSVNAGENVRGTVNVAGVNDTGLAGGDSFLIAGQTFNSIPAPGALALLGLAGLVGSRRRRG